MPATHIRWPFPAYPPFNRPPVFGMGSQFARYAPAGGGLASGCRFLLPHSITVRRRSCPIQALIQIICEQIAVPDHLSPCISLDSHGCYCCSGGSGRETGTPLVHETVDEHGSPSAVPLNPNSRSVRVARPHLQGRVMEQVYVGIDVAKDRLDVHLRPSGEAFAVPTAPGPAPHPQQPPFRRSGRHRSGGRRWWGRDIA